MRLSSYAAYGLRRVSLYFGIKDDGINLLAFPSQRTYFSSSCKHAAMSLIKTAKVSDSEQKRVIPMVKSIASFNRERLLKESHNPENLSNIILRVLNQYA
jgi:hypothetical protein